MTQYHALIIDDNPKNLRVLSQLLNRQGVAITEVSDPSLLQDLVPTLGPIDVVFLDLEMPYATGYDVQPWLREQLGNVPVIAHTVHVSEINAVQHLGFDGFIAKPLDNDRFPDQLARILRGEAVWDRV